METIKELFKSSSLALNVEQRLNPLLLLLASIFMVFSVTNYSQGSFHMAASDITLAVSIFLVNFALQRNWLPAILVILLLLVLFAWALVSELVFTGSISSFLFYYGTIPFFVFYIAGKRIGIIYTLVIIALIWLVWLCSLWFLFSLEYTTEELLFFTPLFAFCAVCAWMFEREREDNNKKLREAGLRHETLMEALNEVYYKVGMDGIIIEIGEAIFSLTGFSAKEVEARPIATFYADPVTRDAYLKALKEKGSVKNYPIEILGKQGQHVMISMSSRMFFDDLGEPVYIEGLIRDITQEKKREEERKANLTHLKSLGLVEEALSGENLKTSIESAIEVVQSLFESDRVFLTSLLIEKGLARQDFLVEAKHHQGFDLKTFLKEDEVQFFLSSLPKQNSKTIKVVNQKQAFSPFIHKTYQIESNMLTLIQTAEDEYWLLCVHNAKQPVEKEQSEHLFADIANRIGATLKQLLLQQDLELAVRIAEVASKAKGDFVATMSHELRTPLHGIIGLLDLMGMDAGQLSKEQQQNLALAQASTQVLRSLIDDVLDLSKIESGNVDIQKQAFDLQQTLTDALIPFAMKAREKHIDLSLEMREVAQVVEGDMQRLRQVLLNLVGNALKFTMQGYVRIVATQDSESLYIHIEDSGIGIERHKQAEVFKPFTQVHNENVLGSNLQEKGTGLGTTISQYFIKMMGGELSLRSEPSVGSTMTICLPLQAVGDAKVSLNLAMDDLIQAPAIPADNADSDAATTKEKTWRVLLAEDDPVGRRVAVKRLERSGFDVETAADGIQAYEVWQSGEFDLVLTDVRMPGINGLELTQKIRLDEQTSQTHPVIIVGLSAYALEDVKKDALACGMDAFITKPVDMQVLTQILEEKCGK